MAGACNRHPDEPWLGEFVNDRMVDVCRACPVMQTCLMEALDGDPDREVGVRAATTEQDRRDIRAGRCEPWDVWSRQDQLRLMDAFCR